MSNYPSTNEQRAMFRSLGFVRIDRLMLMSDGKVDTVILAPQVPTTTFRADAGMFLIATKGGELWCRFSDDDIDERWNEIAAAFQEEKVTPGSLNSPFKVGTFIDPYDLIRRMHDPNWAGRERALAELGLIPS
jgi:hypothetical protein